MCSRKKSEPRLENIQAAETNPGELVTSIVENADGPIFSVDRNYQYTSFNFAHAALMKALYGAEIQLGQDFSEYVKVREDWETVKTYMDRAFGGVSFLESAYFGNEENYRPCLALVLNPIKTAEGEVTGVSVFAWDITGRRQAEEAALREREKRFRTIVDFTYGWEYWLLPDGSLSYVSPTCKEICGYTAEEFQQDPGLLLRIIHPDDKEDMERYLQAVLHQKNEECCGKEFRILTREGAIRWIERVCRAVYDTAGDFQGCRASLRDITERKIRETEMRTLQLAVESVAASIIITNTNAEIEYVNHKFTELTGYSMEETIGKNPRFLKDPEKSSDEYMEMWETITTGRTWQGFFRNIKKNGEYFWEAATISPVFDEMGNIIRYVAVKEDVTERRQAEMALQESNAKFRRLVQKTPLPLCFINREGTVGYLNDRFSETFGYTGEDLRTLVDWWELAYPDKKYRQWVMEKWEDAVEKANLEGKDIEAGEFKISCKNGEVRTAGVVGIMMENNILIALTDVTERRRQERLLKASYERKKKNELLNELVQERLPSKQTLTASARMLGMRVIEPFNCYIIAVDAYRGKHRSEWVHKRDEYQQLIDSLVDELADEACITWESNEGVGVLWFDTLSPMDRKEDQIQQAESLRSAIARVSPEVEVSIGIAERVATLTEIGVHYRQAVVAAGTGRRVWPKAKIYHYLDIGVFQLLPYLQDKKQVDAYIERMLGPLLRYDKKKREEYLDTLEIIIISDNLKEAAQQLAIHYKSLMFRKQRLEEILGISLDVFATRMAVATAVHLMKLHTEKRE